MTAQPERNSRWRLAHDVVVFQVKLGLEAVLDVALIPVSLAAAGLDLLVGNWRRPFFFHAVLALGERCENWIDLWGVASRGAAEGRHGVDALMQDIEARLRKSRMGPKPPTPHAPDD